MTYCRWDRTAERHLLREHRPDCTSPICRGCQPCRHDDDGNPVRHCRVRRRCTSHLGWDEHACPGCLARIRANLDGLQTALAAMPAEAAERGIDSEPANLAGPHADYVTASWRLINADRAGESVEELDMLDPYTCLTFHERTIRELLGHDSETLVSPTIAGCAGYLGWVLTDLARDESMVPILADLLATTARLRDHAETVLRDSRAPERGAPCRSCPAPAPRLILRRGHWCEDPDCDREHYADDSGDRWVCPEDRDHEWSAEDYRRWVYADARAAKSEKRTEETADVAS